MHFASAATAIRALVKLDHNHGHHGHPSNIGAKTVASDIEGKKSTTATEAGVAKKAVAAPTTSKIMTPALRRWHLVRMWLPQVIELGRKEGILPKVRKSNNRNKTEQEIQEAKAKEEQLGFNKNEDVIKILAEDVSMAHTAIPYLPLPVAILCFIMNLLVPGTGTLMSGIMVCFVGQSRMLPTEGRLLVTFFINLLVALSQLCTVTFFLVGWFWSIAWGGLMITYSIDYRDALIRYRREAVTAVALDALTKHSLWNRKRVRNLVTQGLKKSSEKEGVKVQQTESIQEI